MSDQYHQVDPLTGKPLVYQSFGTYPPPLPPPPPPRKRTRLFVLLAILLVVAVGAVVTVVVLLDNNPQPVAVAQDPTLAPPPPAGTHQPKPSDARVPAITPGWQGVLSIKEQVAYDVPKDWKVESPGTQVGFNDNDSHPVAIMHGATTYKPEACPDSRGSYRGHTGFVSVGSTDPQRAALNGVRLFADAAALNPDDTRAPVAITDPKPTTIANGTPAVTATARVTITHPTVCPSPTILFTSVAFKNGNSTALFMMYLDEGVPDALAPDIAEQIIKSIRPRK
ncbi:hypothetical protein [Actinokineospora diospyrosa]|uniref:DUF8017 domain-containing protein n=1 Tax=Actinokineospora diospyrosa TaxID=103728 RepID=A0ABT1IJS8_9PSEU|nr:hypothetical protein [Actinokineospora diospyrosa]MCP2272793.1 hypothetical protein [Actinokineospora diospyrosa]